MTAIQSVPVASNLTGAPAHAMIEMGFRPDDLDTYGDAVRAAATVFAREGGAP